MKAIRIHEVGGPEKMVWEDVPDPIPSKGQARLRLHASGVNFIDVYHRSGLYKVPVPFTPGVEGAGVVDAIGEGVQNLSVGDRVAFAMNLGSYAPYVCVRSELLVKLSADVEFPTAAACMLQGMTAHYLTHSTYPRKSGELALIHAGAGGTGALIVQMARMKGATTITTVSTDEKAAIALEAGADHVLVYSREDFEEGVKKITDGRGVDVVYESVGAQTFDKSLQCLKRRGMMVLFGQASGPVPPLDPSILNTMGSLYLTRPSLAHFSSPEEIRWRAGDIFQWIAGGKLKLRIDRSYPLAAAAEAHRALEGRNTAGKLLLIP